MTGFDPLPALLGGALIGVAVSVMLLFNGRVTGVSGIFGGLLRPKAGDLGWRTTFVLGLVGAGVGLALFAPDTIAPATGRSLPATALAGLLVGFGVRLGNGCTSGHGICGLTRFSRRSMVATATFMATGVLAATFVQLKFGGVL